MPHNKTQFQEGISLLKFMEKFATEDQCENALFSIRWPDDFNCASCGHDSYCFIVSGRLY